MSTEREPFSGLARHPDPEGTEGKGSVLGHVRRYRRFFGADPKRDVDEELAFHLAMRTEEYRRAGLSDTEAEEATMQRFGDMREIRAEVEDIALKRHARRRRAWQLDALLQDLRFALRTLIANPA